MENIASFINNSTWCKQQLLIFVLAIIIFNLSNAFSQTIQRDSITSLRNSLAFKQDTIASQAEALANPKDYVPITQFTYAGHLRYTMDGSRPRSITEIKPATMGVVGGVYIGAIVFLHIHQQNAWWSGNRGNFHFQEDWVSALQVDKAGHS